MIDGHQLENSMIIPQKMPGWGNTAGSRLRDTMSRSRGSVPTLEHTAVEGDPAKPRDFVERGSSGVSFSPCDNEAGNLFGKNNKGKQRP